MYLLKIKDGHLFPAKEELLNPPADGAYKSWMSYETYLTKIRNICDKLFTRDGPWGTHTCRKTGYLFAVWGGGSFESIMSSARHSDINTAKKYERDAKYLLEVAKINGFALKGTVSIWKPIFIESVQLGRSIGERTATTKSLLELATNWLAKSSMTPTSVNFSVSYVLESSW